MSVETLFSKDNRLTDPGLDRQITAKAVRPDSVAQADSTETAVQQPLKENAARLNAIQQNEKTSTEPAEKPVRAIEFDTIQIRQTLEQISKLIPIANTKLVFEFDDSSTTLRVEKIAPREVSSAKRTCKTKKQLTKIY